MKIENLKNVGIFIGIIILTSFTSSSFAQQKNRDFETGKNLEIFFNTYKGINTMYVDSLNNNLIVRKAIDAMLKELDPYTVYFDEKEMKDFTFATTGKYGGVGALIRKKDVDNYGIVESTYKGFPMDKAGVIGGDTIIAIDGIDVKKAKVGDLSSKMKGKSNSIVKMRIKSLLTGKIKNHNIKREIIKISPIDYSGFINDSIGYISFNTFSKDGAEYFKKALLEMKETGNLKGLVLDLRNNGGGIIDEAVNIVGCFVPKGTKVVDMKGRSKKNTKTYSTHSNPIDLELPLAVLINSSSASASEIVTGTLQDRDRAVIIGGRSFGKGLVQGTQNVGFGSIVKVTIAKYYIPSGRCIQALDYSHRNEDGSVGKVPDSLVTKFKTLNGRTVYDGGGITPDIKIESKYMSIFVASIYARGYFDDFSINYFKKYRTAPAIDFSLSEKEYQNFCSFIMDKDIEFSSKSESNLEKLIESSKKEKIYDKIKNSIDSIEVIIKHKDREKSLKENKKEIISMIESSIVGRYYYQAGKVEKMIKKDTVNNKAIEILSNNKKYNSILTTK
ncbi:MAG: S41 family peptidase [Bacteroidetes bacterium]|nr:S41 family peptidase [Bacteroidota bacterium]